MLYSKSIKVKTSKMGYYMQPTYYNKIFINFSENDRQVFIINCNIDILPEIPLQLLELYCCGNNITEIPNLPNGMKCISASINNIQELNKYIPLTLQYLYFSDNPLKYISHNNLLVFKKIFEKTQGLYNFSLHNTPFSTANIPHNNNNNNNNNYNYKLFFDSINN